MQNETLDEQRQRLREQARNKVLQVDGQVDANDNDENDEMMIIDNADNCTSVIVDSALSDDLNYMPELPLLLRLNWDDVLYTSLLPLLSIEDLFRLRATSASFRTMVDGYFGQLKTLDLSSIGGRFTTTAFKVSQCYLRCRPDQCFSNLRVLFYSEMCD